MRLSAALPALVTLLWSTPLPAAPPGLRFAIVAAAASSSAMCFGVQIVMRSQRRLISSFSVDWIVFTTFILLWPTRSP